MSNAQIVTKKISKTLQGEYPAAGRIPTTNQCPLILFQSELKGVLGEDTEWQFQGGKNGEKRVALCSCVCVCV